MESRRQLRYSVHPPNIKGPNKATELFTIRIYFGKNNNNNNLKKELIIVVIMS